MVSSRLVPSKSNKKKTLLAELHKKTFNHNYSSVAGKIQWAKPNSTLYETFFFVFFFISKHGLMQNANVESFTFAMYEDVEKVISSLKHNKCYITTYSITAIKHT